MESYLPPVQQKIVFNLALLTYDFCSLLNRRLYHPGSPDRPVFLQAADPRAISVMGQLDQTVVSKIAHYVCDPHACTAHSIAIRNHQLHLNWIRLQLPAYPPHLNWISNTRGDGGLVRHYDGTVGCLPVSHSGVTMTPMRASQSAEEPEALHSPDWLRSPFSVSNTEAVTTPASSGRLQPATAEPQQPEVSPKTKKELIKAAHCGDRTASTELIRRAQEEQGRRYDNTQRYHTAKKLLSHLILNVFVMTDHLAAYLWVKW